MRRRCGRPRPQVGRRGEVTSSCGSGSRGSRCPSRPSCPWISSSSWTTSSESSMSAASVTTTCTRSPTSWFSRMADQRSSTFSSRACTRAQVQSSGAASLRMSVTSTSIERDTQPLVEDLRWLERVGEVEESAADRSHFSGGASGSLCTSSSQGGCSGPVMGRRPSGPARALGLSGERLLVRSAPLEVAQPHAPFGRLYRSPEGAALCV